MHTAPRIAACVLALGVTLPAAAGDIYKCVTRDATSYQSVPCARGDAQTRMNLAGAARAPRGEPQAVAVAPAPARERRATGPGPWRHRTLTLGMSDDEVLNLPGWGRPARIARTRTPRGWHEVWTYDSGVTGERQLRFTNARLSDIVDAPAAQVAMMP